LAYFHEKMVEKKKLDGIIIIKYEIGRRDPK